MKNIVKFLAAVCNVNLEGKLDNEVVRIFSIEGELWSLYNPF